MKISRILALLVISSLMFQYIPANHFSSEFTSISDNNDVRYNTEANEYEIEVYSQNDLEKTAETLSWWPNDDRDSTMMQFIITIDDVDILADLQNITFSAYTLYDGFQVSLFSLEITPGSLFIADEDLISIVNYSYNSDILSGDYNLELDLLFNDGGEVQYQDDNQIIFHKYGYKISSELLDSTVDFCQNYETIIPIKLQNIGEINTLLNFDLTIIENFSPEEITYDFDPDSFVELFAGEISIVNILMIIEDFDQEQNFIEQLELSFEVKYYDENTDNFVLLEANALTFETSLLPEYSNPGYIFTHLEYGVLANTLIDNSSKANVEFYVLQNDTISFSLQLFNLGFNEEIFLIDILQDNLDYQVILDNITYPDIESLNEEGLKVARGSNIEITFVVSGLQNNDEEQFSLSLNSISPRHSAKLEINFTNQPMVNNDLILTSNSSTTMFNLSNNDTADVGVNISQYSELLTFENQWTVNCDIEGLIEVTLHPLEQRCDASNDEQQISINSSMELLIHFNFDQTLPAGNYYLNLTINHDPNVQDSNLSHSIMFQLFFPLIEDDQNNTDPNQNNSDGNQTDDNQTNGNNSSTNNNTTGTPVDDCADIQCDACPIGMVSDPNGGCCACMEAPETNVDSGNQTGEQGGLQNGDSTKTATKESNMPTYLIIGLVIAALVAAVVIIRARKSSETQQIVSNKTITQLPMPALPLPGLPIPSAPVVLQEWTDDNGYSWRQMSDRTIMWWNGSDWIPYGKN
ncbi:MAG: hypothetical protein ACJ0CN_04955 [Candidatus Poseidoniaceae archaeon]